MPLTDVQVRDIRSDAYAGVLPGDLKPAILSLCDAVIEGRAERDALQARLDAAAVTWGAIKRESAVIVDCPGLSLRLDIDIHGRVRGEFGPDDPDLVVDAPLGTDAPKPRNVGTPPNPRIASGEAGRIETIPGKCGGRPCFAGTRVWVSCVTGAWRWGYSDADVLAMWPELTPADLDAVRDVSHTREDSDIGYVCAACGAMARGEIGAVLDTGTTLDCEECGESTVVVLRTPAQYVGTPPPDADTPRDAADGGGA